MQMAHGFTRVPYPARSRKKAVPMNPAMIMPILLVLLGGGLLALQPPTNVMLAKAGGSPVLAALLSFAVGTAALLTVWLASGNRPGTSPFAALPWYAWLGGIYGAVYVAVAAYAAPRLGLAALITIGIAGQILTAMWLDHIGALGLPQYPISFARVGGALLVVAGVVLVRRG
jgi:transporter family-2 protein